MNPVLPHSVFLRPISLSTIISRANSCFEETLKTGEDSLTKSWPINFAREIPVAVTNSEDLCKTSSRKRCTGVVFKARKCRRIHDLVMFVVEVPVTTHVDSPPWICIMRNYTCANSAHRGARMGIHTRTRGFLQSIMIVGYLYRRWPLRHPVHYAAWITTRIQWTPILRALLQERM